MKVQQKNLPNEVSQKDQYLLLLICIDDSEAEKNLQSEIIKYADVTVLIEKLDYKSEIGD